MTTPTLSLVTLLVREYDEAIEYFTQVLGFVLVTDSRLSPDKRWVVVSPDTHMGVLLARASTPEQVTHIGNQTGGRVAFFLQTNDFVHVYSAMKERGVRFVEEPREESYGRVAVFEDLYGNRWDLLERT